MTAAITARPACRPDTLPFASTVATRSSLLVQVTCADVSAGVKLAVRLFVSPVPIDRRASLRVMAVGIFSTTVTCAVL